MKKLNARRLPCGLFVFKLSDESEFNELIQLHQEDCELCQKYVNNAAKKLVDEIFESGEDIYGVNR